MKVCITRIYKDIKIRNNQIAEDIILNLCYESLCHRKTSKLLDKSNGFYIYRNSYLTIFTLSALKETVRSNTAADRPKFKDIFL